MKTLKLAITLLLLALSSCTVYQNSSLETAIGNNDYNGVKTALAKGADPNAATRNRSGHSMTSYAAYKGNSRISSLLQSHGGKSNSISYGNNLKVEHEIVAARRQAEAEERSRQIAAEEAAKEAAMASHCKWCNDPDPTIRDFSGGWLGGDTTTYGYFCSNRCKTEYWESRGVYGR